jgi:ligand-binding sensor domain-containing protein
LTSFSQPENWIWRTYDQSDGLTSSHVTAFAEDHHGFIWMGTDIGLNRFDGTHFSTFQANESDSTALINGRIMTICPDDKNNLLVGTYAGISLFDYHTGRFKSWKFNFDGLDPLEQNFIRGFVNWKDGHTWVATLACVVDWDREKNTFQVLDSTYNVSRYGAGNPLIPDEDGWGCWMATSSGMKYYNRRNGMLTIIDPSNEVGHDNSKERYLEAYTKDKEGRIWYSVLSEGKIYCYDPKTGAAPEVQSPVQKPFGCEPILFDDHDYE